MSPTADHKEVDDLAVGRMLRVLRIRQGLRQVDVAAAAGVSRQLVSRAECGRIAELHLEDVRAVGLALQVRLQLAPSWRGGELDRVIAAGHAAMHEQIASMFTSLEGWTCLSEVTFSIYGERGSIDVLAWHAVRRALLVIELKTEIADPSALIAQTDRYRRLARLVASERGWDATTVSAWVVVADSTMNRTRLGRHRTMLRNAFPLDGRAMSGWLRAPERPIAVLSFLRCDAPASTARVVAPVKRVCRRHELSRRCRMCRNARPEGIARDPGAS